MLIEHFLTEAAFAEAIRSREESARASERRARKLKAVVRGCIIFLSLMMICAAYF